MKQYYNKTIITVLGICCTVLFSACNSVCSCKQVACPAYTNTNFDQWFPYQATQQIVFADTSNKANDDTIIINDASATTAYEANKGCINGDAGCSSDKNISANSFYVAYNSMNDWDGTPVDSNYHLLLHEFSVDAKGIGTEGFVNATLPAQFYNTIYLNGKEFRDVQVISKPDTSGVKDYIYQVYIQKNTGLLAYRYYPSQVLFIKQ